jgi:hypothetical protein
MPFWYYERMQVRHGMFVEHCKCERVVSYNPFFWSFTKDAPWLSLIDSLADYAEINIITRTHLGLAKDAPLQRGVQRSGTVVATPILSGLHHRYARI